MASCEVCGRSGTPPRSQAEYEQRTASIRGTNGKPWIFVAVAPAAHTQPNPPPDWKVVCSKTCAIEFVLRSEIRDVERGGMVS